MRRDAFERRTYSKETAALVAIAVVGLLLALFSYIQTSANKARSFQSSAILVDQVEGLIDANEQTVRTLESSLKEDYILRAIAIAYIIDHNPQTANDIDELRKIAALQSVDEIHLFDTTGTIVGGTIPKYYGLSFDSGEQMAYFKPMLTNRTLSMCQDVTPNTAEAKQMMYAICWDEAGKQMIQIGIEPVRLLAEMHASSLTQIIDTLPAYEGSDVFVADPATGVVEGSTLLHSHGATLASLGLDLNGIDLSNPHMFTAVVEGQRAYCVAHEFSDKVVVVIERASVANEGIGTSLIVTLVYLVLSALLIIYIVRRMTAALIEEQRNANVDQLTQFLNRRAYETTVREYDSRALEHNFVYVSFDLNGLKTVNDTQGHDEGDKLICGCAECLRRCAGNYGDLYRIGGDEFCALLFVDEERMAHIVADLEESTAQWSAQHGLTLSISLGYVSRQEMPQASFSELAKCADDRMYQAKRHYYETCGATGH